MIGEESFTGGASYASAPAQAIVSNRKRLCGHIVRYPETWAITDTLQGVFKEMDRPTLGQRASFRSENNGSGVMAAWSATREEQLR